MTTLDRLKKVFGILMPDFDISRITPESELASDLGITSITVLLLVIGIEEEFSIRFENVRSDSFRTVADVCGYIEKRMADGNVDGKKA